MSEHSVGLCRAVKFASVTKVLTRLRHVAACAMVFLFMHPYADAQTPPLVTLVSGANHNLLPTNDATYTVRVPIAVASGKAIKLQKLDVAFKDGRSDDLFKAFEVSQQLAEGNVGAAFVVKATGNLWPGTYVLSLNAIDAAVPATEQSVVLSLQVPAPQVSGSTKVVVSQALNLFRGRDAGSGVLVVRELSNKIGALQLSPTETHDPPAHGDSDTATLTFEPAASAAAHFTVPAKFKVVPSGDFPLGVTAGRIDVISPSLASPLSVPFEVRVHRSEFLIIVISALGTLAGWFLRTRLTARQSVLAAKSAIAAAMRTTLRSKLDRDDEEYNKALSGVFLSLSDAEETEDPKTMTDAAKAAEDAVKALQNALEARVPPIAAKLESIHKVTDVQWRLPDAITSGVAKIGAAVQASAKLLNRRSLAASDDLASTQLNVAIPNLVRQTADFVRRLAAYLQAATENQFPLSESYSAQLLKLAATAADGASAVQTTVRAGTLEEAVVVLNKADSLYDQVAGFSKAAVPLAENLCGVASGQLREAFPAIGSRFDPVQAQSVAAAKAFAEGISQAAGGPYPVDGASLRDAWQRLLLELSPDAPVDQLGSALTQGKWLDAVAVAIRSKRVAGVKEKALSEDDVLACQSVAFQDLSDGGPEFAGTSPASLGTELPIDTARQIVDQGSQRKILIAKGKKLAALQSAGFGLIFVIGAYFLYGDTWVGTSKEIITIFILAFGLDLTSDSLVAALKKTA